MHNTNKTDLGTVQKVTVEKMKFLYEEVANDHQSQQKAWPQFEARVLH